eukprot:TRINITY_DN11296_c0_g1::TRINITY_DN11296_c0_g1_i1::g.705::m.705 TRINITY_DN11296_c0_g1::TRINITY_DN11296_c0_g1_i1::g.705  ORF type:complete len:548 (-),score=89.52,sp/Q86JB0/Y8324_DICDI/28.75/2e-15,Methyltransf_16/PF10294.4/6.3e-09,Methyltransf_16/PF10294.4/35,MTS/PF05175.9/5.1e-05,Methyltransf_18/PF12847.2/0.00095,Methyltransf_18/PF12847.2/1.3e+03,PrmA/PF06325.8/0.032,Methyltransf_26/PF13659.1/0.21,DUF605/PF04652.11/0.11,PCMT/PF01135.14/0.15 TRINITY_DN11296_c0_g1_i1:465-2108(-)
MAEAWKDKIIDEVRARHRAVQICVIPEICRQIAYNAAVEEPGVEDLSKWWTTTEAQERIYNEVVKEDLIVKCPPPRKHTFSFLKRYVDALGNREIYDPLLEIFMDYLQEKSDAPAGQVTGYRTYELRNSDLKLVTLREASTFNETGLTSWEAGWYLFEFILKHPELFAGQRVLEFGSGLGSVGVALHNVKASRIVLTDYQAKIVENIEHNMRINQVHVHWDDLDLLLEPGRKAKALEAEEHAGKHIPVGVDVMRPIEETDESDTDSDLDDDAASDVENVTTPHKNINNSNTVEENHACAPSVPSTSSSSEGQNQTQATADISSNSEPTSCTPGTPCGPVSAVAAAAAAATASSPDHHPYRPHTPSSRRPPPPVPRRRGDLAVEVAVVNLESSDLDHELISLGDFDIVLGADIFFDPSLIHAIAHAMQVIFMTPEDAPVHVTDVDLTPGVLPSRLPTPCGLFATAVRNEDTYHLLQESLNHLGMCYVDITPPKYTSDATHSCTNTPPEDTKSTLPHLRHSYDPSLVRLLCVYPKIRTNVLVANPKSKD